MVRHATAIFQQLSERYEPLRIQFEAVEALTFHPSFDKACETLRSSLSTMLAILENGLRYD